MSKLVLTQVNLTSSYGGGASVWYDKAPDEYPMCHKGIQPTVATGTYIGTISQPDSEVRIFFQCTKTSCREPFIGRYKFNPKTENNFQGSPYYELTESVPRTAVQKTFGESIQTTSPDFIEIYNQAMGAEAYGLDEMTGMGLRKSLEFLIKDFLITQHPTKAEDIKKKFLGTCIKEYVTDTNLKITAERATWLGNDETHYVRRWEDKDVEDLKTLIRITVNWIDNVLLTQKYLKDMDPATPTKVSTTT